jgi:regulator of sirC expression with transglutaminase-like and TPR domain
MVKNMSSWADESSNEMMILNKKLEGNSSDEILHFCRKSIDRIFTLKNNRSIAFPSIHFIISINPFLHYRIIDRSIILNQIFICFNTYITKSLDRFLASNKSLIP